jgi:hypothetical protein
MSRLSHDQLLDALAEYGYQLNRPARSYRPEDFLLDLIEEKDPRLVEGFPVVYGNILDRGGLLKWGDPDWNFEGKLSDAARGNLIDLLLLSYFLFRLYGENRSKLERTENVLSKLSEKWKDRLDSFENRFNRSESVTLAGGLELSTERLKNQFRNYVMNRGSTKEDPLKQDLELEVLLSQFFAPRQKELLKKHLSGETLSKTEKEYFCRVVKKRLKALSNEKLHGFVKSVIGGSKQLS